MLSCRSTSALRHRLSARPTQSFEAMIYADKLLFDYLCNNLHKQKKLTGGFLKNGNPLIESYAHFTLQMICIPFNLQT